jgi:hypothetical protein
MTQFPAGDPFYAAAEIHEAYHTGGGRELSWRDEMLAGGKDFALVPGQGLMVPVMAPHFVRNGPVPSVSLSITWRSEWSYEEGAARAFNGAARLGPVARAARSLARAEPHQGLCLARAEKAEAEIAPGFWSFPLEMPAKQDNHVRFLADGATKALLRRFHPPRRLPAGRSSAFHALGR